MIWPTALVAPQLRPSPFHPAPWLKVADDASASPCSGSAWGACHAGSSAALAFFRFVAASSLGIESVTALHVAIVIVGFRNLPDIQRCLGALEASTYRDFEILICENGGDQAFSELVHALPSALPGGQPIRAVQAPGKLGYAGGVNIGMTEPGEEGRQVGNECGRRCRSWWLRARQTT